MKKLLLILLAVIDIALAVVIVTAKAPEPSSPALTLPQIAADVPQPEPAAAPFASEENPEGSEEIPEKPEIISEEQEVIPEESEVLPEEPTVDLSTEEKPGLSDFMWYFDNVYYNGIPGEAEAITDAAALNGGWKSFRWYDPEYTMDSYMLEFLNADISIEGDRAEVTLTLNDLHLPDGTVIDESGSEPLRYQGAWDGSRIEASGGGAVHIETFYMLGDGKQYAVGTFDSPDGIPAYIALVRP